MRATATILTASLLAASAWAQSPSGTLPVLHVRTDGEADISPKDTYVGAACHVDDARWGCGDAEHPLRAQVKGRGNYTWTAFDKKPYHLKLDVAHALPGMPESRHYLLPHADDWLGYLRNTVGFELSRRIGLPYTPRQEPIELVINGDYRGLYFVTEQVRVEPGRVEIVEQLSDDRVHDPGEGGWLIEIDNYRGDNQVVIPTDTTRRTLFTVHSPKSMSAVQRRWVTDRLTRVDSLVRHSSPDDDVWAEWIDPDALARFYIVQELTDNIEAFHGSCFMTIAGDGDDVIRFGPVWDFGNAFARGYAGEQRFITDGDDSFNRTWIGPLTRHPGFIGRVRQLWTDFYERGGTDVDAFIDEFTTRITGAIASNHERWPDYDTDAMPARWATYKQFLARRVEFLNNHWSLSTVGQVGDSGVRVDVGAGAVRVAGASPGQTLTLHRADGRTVYRGLARELTGLTPGVYLLTVGNHRQKLLIP